MLMVVVIPVTACPTASFTRGFGGDANSVGPSSFPVSTRICLVWCPGPAVVMGLSWFVACPVRYLGLIGCKGGETVSSTRIR